jgi:hypothetical protein
MPITRAEREALIRSPEPNELIAIARSFFDAYVSAELPFDARRAFAEFAMTGATWKDAPSATSPQWRASQLALLRAVEKLPNVGMPEPFVRALAAADAVERVKLAALVFDALVGVQLDDDHAGMYRRLLAVPVAWGEIVPDYTPNTVTPPPIRWLYREQFQELRRAVVASVAKTLGLLPDVFAVVEAPPSSPNPEPAADADLVLDPEYQVWLARENARAIEELEDRALKAAAEAAKLEAQAHAMREAAMPRPAPTEWEVDTSKSIEAADVGAVIDTEQQEEHQEGAPA